jgi:VWFA-related protein
MKKGLMFFLICFCPLFYGLYGLQQVKHEVAVRLVLVDVIATKDGEFVKDLTAADFEVKEDGKKIPINSFELISFEERELSIQEQEPQRSERPQKKLAVIFDGINAWEKDIQENIDKIVEELVPLVKLGNEVMVCQLNEAKGVEVLQPFTSDEGAIRTAIASATGNMWNPGQDIFSTKLDEWARVKDPWYRKWESTRADVTWEPKSQGDDPQLIWDLQLSTFLSEERLRFEKTIGGIFATCSMLGSLPGRKSVLLISGGIPDLSPRHIMPRFAEADFHPGTEGFKPDADTANAMRQSSLNTGDIGRMRLFDPFQLEEKKEFTTSEEVIRELIRYANAQNVSIYSLDAGVFSKYLFPGTASAASIDERDVQIRRFISKERIKRVQNLSWLSEDTGADALRGAGKYDQFRQVMRSDLTHYYQLSFYPKRKKADDKHHKISVEVKRRGIDIRHRKGYTDYSKEGANRLKLITAFYNPSLYKELPIEASFIPFVNDSGKYVPWMSIALPTQELFLDKNIPQGKKTFNLHVWISDTRTGEKGFGGTIDLPIKIDPSFMDYARSVSHVSFHFKGPELAFRPSFYQTVFALADPETDEVGTWESVLPLPEFKDFEEGAIINCVLGNVVQNPKKAKSSFALSRKDGSLEYEGIKFFPKIIDSFAQEESSAVFLQVFLPQGKQDIHPEISIVGEDEIPYPVEASVAVESWNNKIKIWSGIFHVDLSIAFPGDNMLIIEYPGAEEDSPLRRELQVMILQE